MQLSTDDLIKLAATGNVKNIVLDDMAKEVFHDCLSMLRFEKDYYEREKKRRDSD